MVSAMHLCAVSPKNPSPLSSHPPFRPQSCSPPPLKPIDLSREMTSPVPIHSRSGPFTTNLASPVPRHQRHRHPDSLPSPSSSAQLDGPYLDSPGTAGGSGQGEPISSPTSPSRISHHRKLSTSHSLAGSYTLSLLSSRMSHAHTPHTLPSAFTVQIASTGFGCAGPSSGKPKMDPRLRCPPHVRIPFEGRWYDLEGGPGGAAVGTPWVGCVDLEGHYRRAARGDQAEGLGIPRGRSASMMGAEKPVFPGQTTDGQYRRERKRSSTSHLSPDNSPTTAQSWTSSSHRSQHPADFSSSAQPPIFPGYQLAPQGLLQLVIKNEVQAIKVFLIRYDLNALEIGGKLLVRERDYVAVPLTPSPSRGGGTGSGSDSVQDGDKRREVLRSAVELQFTCVEDTTEKKKRKKRFTEPVQRAERWEDRAERTGVDDASNGMSISIEGDSWRLDGGSALSINDETETKLSRSGSNTLGKRKSRKAYYLSKQIRLVFPSLCGNLTSRDQADKRETAKEDVRTERFIEVINPSAVQPGMSVKEIKKMRRASFASESWEGVKAMLVRKVREDKEDDQMEGQANETSRDGQDPQETIRKRSILAPLTRSSMTFERTPALVQPVPHRGITSLLTARFERREGSVDSQADDEDQTIDLRHWHREIGLDPASPSPVTSPVDKKRSLWPEDDSERLLSESLQRLPWRR